MTQKPMLNLGCGRVILPAPRPAHYGLLDPITDYPLWLNVDRNAEPGVDEMVDIFRYPFPWADDSFDGALCAHLCEHIPHEIRTTDDWLPAVVAGAFADEQAFIVRADELSQLQDGWYAFFAELHRVCTAGSIIHVLSPFAWSDAGITDPTHTRLLTPASFMHSMVPDPNAPFKYATGGLHLELVDAPRLNVNAAFAHLVDQPALLQHALSTQVNVAQEFYVKLRVVK